MDHRPRPAPPPARRQSATTPVNPQQIVPTNLEGFSGAASNLTPDVLRQNQPRNINEALTRVPGVIVINDDANAHHGGVTVRGSPARVRARCSSWKTATRQHGTLARPVGPFLGSARPLRKHRSAARHGHHPRPQQQLRRHQRPQPVALRRAGNRHQRRYRVYGDRPRILHR